MSRTNRVKTFKQKRKDLQKSEDLVTLSSSYEPKHMKGDVNNVQKVEKEPLDYYEQIKQQTISYFRNKEKKYYIAVSLLTVLVVAFIVCFGVLLFIN